MNLEKKKRLQGAVAFITLMGIVSLFSDMTHEGARSILGEYLNLAGATGATIGFVSGVGELCGYSLRLLSGIFADKTKKYWTLVIAGYTLQVLAIPALALIPQNGWIIACGLVILERVGKAIKNRRKIPWSALRPVRSAQARALPIRNFWISWVPFWGR